MVHFVDDLCMAYRVVGLTLTFYFLTRDPREMRITIDVSSFLVNIVIIVY